MWVTLNQEDTSSQIFFCVAINPQMESNKTFLNLCFRPYVLLTWKTKKLQDGGLVTWPIIRCAISEARPIELVIKFSRRGANALGLLCSH